MQPEAGLTGTRPASPAVRPRGLARRPWRVTAARDTDPLTGKSPGEGVLSSEPPGPACTNGGCTRNCRCPALPAGLTALGAPSPDGKAWRLGAGGRTGHQAFDSRSLLDPLDHVVYVRRRIPYLRGARKQACVCSIICCFPGLNQVSADDRP